MLFCLLQDSPSIDTAEQKAIDRNQSTVAHLGRKPDLALDRNGESITLKTWGLELMDAMLPLAKLLDQTHSRECYQRALAEQRELFENAELTPSAKVLSSMREVSVNGSRKS